MNPRHSCLEELHNVELKVTPARLGVLAALENAKWPLDISSVESYLARYAIRVDKATVFRIINSLTQKGLAVPIQFNEGKLRYEHVKKANHHHFVCENCGEVEDISDCNIGKLEKAIEKQKGLLVHRHSLEFFGTCKKCQH